MIVCNIVYHVAGIGTERYKSADGNGPHGGAVEEHSEIPFLPHHIETETVLDTRKSSVRRDLYLVIGRNDSVTVDVTVLHVAWSHGTSELLLSMVGYVGLVDEKSVSHISPHIIVIERSAYP